MTGNEHRVCWYRDALLSDVECTGPFSSIFSDWDGSEEAKCLILLHISVLVKKESCIE